MTDLPPQGPPGDEPWSPPPLSDPPPGPPASPPPFAPGGAPPGPGYGYPPAAPPGGPPPGYGAKGWGAPPGSGAGPTAGFGYPAAGYGYPGPRRTNGNAIVSLVCGICSLVVCPVLALAGLAAGLRARRQIRDSNGTEDGDGLAIAGLAVSGLGLLYLIGIVVLFAIFAWAGTQPATTNGTAPLATSPAPATAFA